MPEFVRRPLEGLYPLVPLSLDADEDLDDPTVRLWRDRRAINVTELERLNAIWAGPLAEVPLMAMDPGPALVGAVARSGATDAASDAAAGATDTASGALAGATDAAGASGTAAPSCAPHATGACEAAAAANAGTGDS